MDELESLLVLNAIEGLGNSRIKKLLEHFGSAAKVFAIKIVELRRSGIIPDDVIDHLNKFPKDSFLKKEISFINDQKIEIIPFDSPEYPELLKEIPDYPVVLYVKGQWKEEYRLAVAMVGSREASVYGMTTADKIARQLSEWGVTIISGMARGIDTAAHRGALAVKGTTVAVVGNGLSQIYPPENKNLFQSICENGAVISEFPIETPPRAFHFPRRNRIISGLSLGVVVVEASQKSGALITSRFALEQGREVFAIPGKIDNPNAQGVNRLIQQGAKLVSSIEDIIEELKPQIGHFLKKPAVDTSIAVQESNAILTEEETALFHFVTDKALHVDDLISVSGFSPTKTLQMLLQLEIKHMVKQLPGKLFIRQQKSACPAMRDAMRDLLGRQAGRML